MASLSFSKNADGHYEATATVEDDYAIHVEVDDTDTLEICETHVQDTEYASQFTKVIHKAYDKSFHDVVYPKYIKVKLSTEPKSGKNYII